VALYQPGRSVQCVQSDRGEYRGLFLVAVLVYHFEGYSRGLFIIDGVLTFIFIAGLRVSIRLYFTKIYPRRFFPILSQKHSLQKKLLIIGAGDAAEKVLRELLSNPTLNIVPVGFLMTDLKSTAGRSMA